MLDGIVLSLKNLVHFLYNMKHKYPEYVFTVLEAQSNVPGVLH